MNSFFNAFSDSDERKKRRLLVFMKKQGGLDHFKVKWAMIGGGAPEDVTCRFAMTAEQEREFLFAHRFFSELPQIDRVIYALRYAEKFSFRKLALWFQVSIDEVKGAITRVRHEVGSRKIHEKLMRFVAVEIKAARTESAKVTRYILKKAERSAEWALKFENLCSGFDKATFALIMDKISSNIPVISDVISTNINAVSSAMETVTQTVTQNVAALETAVAATTATVVAATSKSVFTFSAVMMTFAFPFLWIMSIIMTGQALGTALVRNAPSLSMRRWLTKQLLVCYCGIVTIPISFVLMNNRIVLNNIGWNMGYYINAFFALLFVSIGVGGITWLNQKYRKLLKTDENSSDTSDFDTINAFVQRGFWGVAVVLTVFCLFLLPMTFFQDFQISIRQGQGDKGIFIASILIITSAVILCAHKSMFALLRYFLAISKDDQALESTPLPIDVIEGNWKIDMIRELVYLAPFVIFTVFPSLVRLLQQTRVSDSGLELITFVPWWCTVLWLNTKSPNYRWRNILGTFVLQVIIQVILRSM